MARSLPVKNLLPQNVVSIINYFSWSNVVAQWWTPSCSRPLPATDNSDNCVRDYIQLTGRTLHTTQGSTPWDSRIARYNAGNKSHDLQQPVIEDRTREIGMPGQRTACAATQGISV